MSEVFESYSKIHQTNLATGNKVTLFWIKYLIPKFCKILEPHDYVSEQFFDYKLAMLSSRYFYGMTLKVIITVLVLSNYFLMFANIENWKSGYFCEVIRIIKSVSHY